VGVNYINLCSMQVLTQVDTLDRLQAQATAPSARSPTSPQTSSTTSQAEALQALANKLKKDHHESLRRESVANIALAGDTADMERQQTRRWRAGDVYAPHDLSGVEMSKWKATQPKGRPLRDSFDILRLNPLDQYRVCLSSGHRSITTEVPSR